MSRGKRQAAPVVDLAFERAKAEARELVARYPALRSERTAAFLSGEEEEAEPMPTSAAMKTIPVRLPPALVDRLDAVTPAAAAAPELATAGKVTRSDVLRLAVLKGLEQLEAEYAGHPALPGMGSER